MTGDIVTLTLNPCIDGACETETVRHTHKIRTSNERYDPGGGGINVARVLTRFGDPVTACYLSGGVTGALLDRLIDQCGVARIDIPIHDDSRISHAIYERSSGKEYRFVPEGPHVSEAEWRQAIDVIAERQPSVLVASGSLPPGIPDDFYALLTEKIRAYGGRVALDTSGAALARAIDAGSLWLVKPSQGEFEALIGRKCEGPADIGEVASTLARQGKAEMIAVTMGHLGAVYAGAEGHFHCTPPDVPVKSATGAGDSFVAGMVHALMQGWEPRNAFLHGMAAGSAAVLTPGTDLCDPADVARLYEMMR